MLFLLVLLATFASGCSAKIFNGGYDTEFYDCPRADNGQCMSVEDAHQSAIDAQRSKENKFIEKYGAEVSLGADSEDDDFNGEKKPLAAMTAQLATCARKKDNDCVKKMQSEIAAYERRSEDRAVARKLYKEDLEEQTLKMAMLQRQAAGAPGMPFRTGDKLMELTLLPYETESGALASSRKFWMVVEEGSWSFEPLTGKGRTKHVIGGLE